MNITAIDTETHPIGPDYPPKLVVASFATGPGEEDAWVLTTADGGIKQAVREALRGVVVLHNAPFDIFVLCRRFPDLLHPWIDALEDGRVHDTMTAEMVLNLADFGQVQEMRLPDGSKKRLEYSLGALAEQYLNLNLDADKKGADSWRTRFDQLDGVPLASLPEEAVRYARQDAALTWLFRERQLARAAELGDELGVDPLQVLPHRVRMHVGLHAMTIRGMSIDPEEYARTRARVERAMAPESCPEMVASGCLRLGEPARPHATRAEQKRLAALLEEWTGDPEYPYHELEPELRAAGIPFKDPVEASLDTKKLQDYVRDLAARTGVELRRTKTGVSLDGEQRTRLKAVEPGRGVIHELDERKAVEKLYTTELPRMEWRGVPADRVRFNFRPLLKTGRSSSHESDKYPSANGQNIHKLVRPCYRATPGWLLVGADYSGLELACVARVTTDVVGYSRHADLLRAGVDIHGYFAAQLMVRLWPEFAAEAPGDPEGRYTAFQALKKTDPADYKRRRALGKYWTLGFPGGAGPPKLILLARKPPNDVDVLGAAADLVARNGEFAVSRTVEWHAKRRGLWDKETKQVRWTPLLRAIALVAEIRDLWRELFPEMVDYGRHLRDHMQDPRHEVLNPWEVEDDEPDDDEEGESKAIAGYRYVSPLGLVRSACSYTEASNGSCMQSPAADGGAIAIWQLFRACHDERVGSILHGCHPVAWIHDEALVEIPDDELAHERATEVGRVMVEAMSRILGDIPVKAEPLLMRTWDKNAEPTFREGRLVPYEPRTTA